MLSFAFFKFQKYHSEHTIVSSIKKTFTMKYTLKTVFFALIFLIATVGYAQQQPLPVQSGLKGHQHFTTTNGVPHNCGHQDVMEELINLDPAFKTAVQNFKSAIPSVSTINSSGAIGAESPPVLTIPVVVHVIHKTGESIGQGQNLSISQIQNQIQIMNDHFRLLNSNFSSNTPLVFQSAAADVEIEFCLANIGPGGSAANGITRHVYDNVNSINQIEDTIKQQTNWDPSLYLNIWTLPIPGTSQLGGTLGYSYLPIPGFAGVDHKDGIVVDYRWFGQGAGISGDGITAVHEAGHYLGLMHTWGDDVNGVPIGCSSDDGITDTPDQAQPTAVSFAGCPPSIPQSCGTNDMYVNYMDYVNDQDCSTMFTQGQTNLMRAVLTGNATSLGFADRSSLLASSASVCSSPCSIVLTTSSTPESCGGLADGTATVSPSGGTPPYSTTWSTNPVQNGTTASGLVAGTYTVTVTDITSCQQVATVTVNTASQVTANFNATAETCVGNDGTITAVPSGGMAPYSIAWGTNPPQSGATISGLATGFYPVGIVDAMGCTYNDVVFVNNICNVECDTITNFTLNYTPVVYQNPFGTGFISGTNSFGDLAKADYYNYQGTHTHITEVAYGFGVAFSNNPLATIDIVIWDGTGGTVGAPLATEAVLISDIAASVNANLPHQVTFAAPVAVGNEFFVGFRIPNNGNDLIAVATSGIGDVPAGFNTAWEQWADGTWYPYDTSWGVEMAHLIGVGLGTPPIAAFSPSNVTGCDSATVTYTSASINADTYEWILPGATPSSSTMANPTVSYNTAGTYDATLVVTNGCLTDTLTFDNAINITSCNSGCNMFTTLSSTPVSCVGGNDGSVTAIPNAGTPPYTYAWNTIPIQTTATVNGLSAGMYSVTVTDGAGCQVTGDVTVIEPDSLLLSMATLDESCFGNDGEAQVTATGGTGPYTYAWSGSQTTDVITGLAQGSYTVTVTDANGCQAVAVATINDGCAGCAMSLSIATNNISCFDEADGSITVTPNFGVYPYTYLWSNGGASTDSIQTNLTAGTYVVTVIDAINCIQSDTLYLTQPDELITFENIVAESCTGNDGQLTIIPQGGTAPYNYLWNTNPPQTTASIVGLAAGDYAVAVIDANGCTISDTLTVPDGCPCGVTLQTVQSGESCTGLDGTASVIASGGVAPYSYQWSTSASDTFSTISGLAFGVYSVTVTDSSGCATPTSVTVVDSCNCGMILSGSSTGETCYAGGDGTATVEIDGIGQAPFTFAWSTTPTQTNQTATGLSQGTYTVTVTDATGCSQTLDIDVEGTLAVTLSSSDASCGINNGSVTAVATGGDGDYTYIWSVPGNTSATIDNLGAGTYSVTVVDGNGCTVDATAVLTQTGQFSVSTAGADNFCSANGATAQAIAVGGGTAPFTFQWSSGDTTAQATQLSTGTYTVTATDANGCTATNTVSVTSINAAPQLTVAQTNVSCFGGSDGAINLTVQAATPVSIIWSNGVSAANLSNLQAGAYTAVVTDANGCVSSTTVVISEPSTLTLIGSSTPALTNDGTASANVNGGTPPYNYIWNNGDTTQTITGLVSGTYQVTVTDKNGCTTNGNVVVSQFTNTQQPMSNLANFNVFPNPNRGTFTIDLDFSRNEQVEISIYNAVGQQVYTYTGENTTFDLPIDLGRQSNGVYFVTLTTNEGRAVKRVMITK